MQCIKEREYFQRKEINFLHELQSPDVLEKVQFP